MKTKLTITLWLSIIATLSFAQLPPNPPLGFGVHTISGRVATDQIVLMYDLSNPSISGGIPGQIWNNQLSNTNQSSNWTLQKLGQIFGIATNLKNINIPVIYVSSSQIYLRLESAVNFMNGYKDLPPTLNSSVVPTNANAALVYALNPNDNINTPVLVSSKNTSGSSVGTSQIFNRGTGIGNICYNPDIDRLFLTNMEDGGIYSVNTITGQIEDEFIPFNNIPLINSGNAPSFAPLDRRLWGIGCARQTDGSYKLFFSRWREDRGNVRDTINNEIWSVQLDASNNYNMTASSLSRELVLPSLTSGNNVLNYDNSVHNGNITYRSYLYSNPVSDIEFSIDGQTMILSERSMAGPYNTVNRTQYAVSSPTGRFFDWAHRSRVLRYDINGTSWQLYGNTASFTLGSIYNGSTHAGLVFSGLNSSGGNDLGYSLSLDSLTSDTIKSCEALVWASGDALLTDGETAPDGVYGFQGMPVRGGGTRESYIIDPLTEVQKLYQKTRPGDIDVFRLACGEECETSVSETVTACGSYVWSAPTGNGLKYNASGVYTHTFSSENGCTTTSTLYLTIKPSPTVSINTPTSNLNTCAFGRAANIVLGYPGSPQCVSVTTDVSGGTSPYLFNWSSISNLSGINNGTALFCPSQSVACSTYHYTITVTDANGCSSSATSEIKVALVGGADVSCGNNKNPKVLVCHIPPGNTSNPRTICISPNALPAHTFGPSLGPDPEDEAHKLDCIGSCQPCVRANRKSLQADSDEFSGEAISATATIENYPEPFREHTTFKFQLDNATDARLEVYDINGKLIQVVFDNKVSAHERVEVDFNANQLPKGVYVYRLTTLDEIYTGKIILMKD